eukprot:jgi/Tetstr1/456764/TSEL_043461.t1
MAQAAAEEHFPEGHRGWQGDKSQRVTYSKKTKAPPQARPNVRRRKLANPIAGASGHHDVVLQGAEARAARVQARHCWMSRQAKPSEKVRPTTCHPGTRGWVFRAVHASLAGPGPAGVRQLQGGNWTAVIDFKGEQFQAFFASEREASEAFAAAGGKKSN